MAAPASMSGDEALVVLVVELAGHLEGEHLLGRSRLLLKHGRVLLKAGELW